MAEEVESVAQESLADRLTEEITLLSTKLVTAVSKQLELEEKLFHFHKENYQLKNKVNELQDIETKYNQVNDKYIHISGSYAAMEKAKLESDAENKKLKAEVEDLTASLFDEANKMVSDASRETYNFKVKNKKLYEEIDEKNVIIDNLQVELVELKKLIEDMEKQSTKHKSFVASDIDVLKQEMDSSDSHFFNSSIFSPKLKAIRFDLDNFKEFKEFSRDLIAPQYQYDLNTLKLNRWFKKIWVEEFENSIIVPSTNFLNRWQKGKVFWNLVADGKIKIEPIKSLNDTFDSPDQVHKGVDAPCEFCHESRHDNLEHSRLHNLKLSNPEVSTESINYPLCNYCLIKIRNIGDFFAKLRLINKNFYKLDFTEAGDNEYKLMKIYVNLCLIRSKNFWGKIGYWDNVNEINQINVDELHVDDFKLLVNEDSCSLHSNEAIKSVNGKERDDIEKTIEPVKNIEELEEIQAQRHTQEFGTGRDTPDTFQEAQEYVKEEVPIAEPIEAIETSEPATSEPIETSEKLAASEPVEPVEPSEAVEPVEPAEPSEAVEPVEPAEPSEAVEPSEPAEPEAPKKSSKKKNKKKKKSKVAGLVSSFEQPEPEPEPELKVEPASEIKDTSNTDASEEEFADSVDHELSRKNSKSKQFTRKMNESLDDTLKMLEESFEEDK